MADFTNVADALVSAIVATVYPSGTGAASIAPGAAPVYVYQGWPMPEQLDADLKAGKAHVSVFPTATERELPLHMADWAALTINAPTIAVAVSGNQVTVSGTGVSGQNVAVIVDGLAFVYAVQADDTPTSIASALGAMINATRSASSTGPVITLPAARSLVARVGATGTSIRELRRQEKVFQISVWANSPALRDPLAARVDVALAAIVRLSMLDGSQAVLRYRSSIQHDGQQKAGIYRRDMLYAVEYSTIQTSVDTQIVTESLGVSPLMSGTPISTVTINS